MCDGSGEWMYDRTAKPLVHFGSPVEPPKTPPAAVKPEAASERRFYYAEGEVPKYDPSKWYDNDGKELWTK